LTRQAIRIDAGSMHGSTLAVVTARPRMTSQIGITNEQGGNACLHAL
jgi:hypothetical protein